MNPLPTVLILTDECISPGHGTGAALLRQLKDYPPEKLLSAFLLLRGDSYFPHSAQIDLEKVKSTPWYRRWRLRGDETKTPRVTPGELIDRFAADGKQIDLVYSNVYGEDGLAMLRAVLEVLPPQTPVIHHAQDFMYQNKRRFETLLKDLSPQIAEFWAIGPALVDALRNITGREARLMTPFQIDIHPQYKTEHRPFGPDCTVAMLGNSHMPWTLHHIRHVWERIGKDVPGLKPIQWYAFPSSVTYVKKAGVVFEPEIEYYGFLNDRALHEYLCKADFAIVPFNIKDKPEYHYAEFSIPSRLTEFVNAGLPVFAAAGTGTDTYRFITENKLGVCATLDDEASFTKQLLAFARDQELRQEIGANNRRFAEEQCDIRHYREQLKERFCAVAQR